MMVSILFWAHLLDTHIILLPYNKELREGIEAPVDKMTSHTAPPGGHILPWNSADIYQS